MDTLRAELAFGIVAFVWAFFCVFLYLFSSVCAQQIRILCLFELIFDSGLCFYGIIVNIVFSTKLDKYWPDSYRASNAFGYLTVIALMISVVLDIVSVIRPPDVSGNGNSSPDAPAP